MKKFGLLIGVLAITIIAILWSIIGSDFVSLQDATYEGIQPSQNHPQYWSYRSREILLLGGSVEDNLFQFPYLPAQLDLLVEVGGNYVRNTMSSRDEGNLWPFAMGTDSLYDLNSWNYEYWQRFENFLKETNQREIIVQMESWATFDFYRENWLVNPYNPKNNINYDSRRSKLAIEENLHPIFTENNFFRSVPSQLGIMKLLEYQQKYVEKILSYTLDYDHVILDKDPYEAYCRGIEGKEYLVYFPMGGQIELNISLQGKHRNIRWLSVDEGEWHSEAEIEINNEFRLTTPAQGDWLALIQ
jgi:hypothetical protein